VAPPRLWFVWVRMGLVAIAIISQYGYASMTFAKKWPTDGIYLGREKEEVKLQNFVMENLRKIRSFIYMYICFILYIS